MGNEGCEGTYKLSGDRLTVTKTIIYTGAKEKQTSDTEKLTVEDDFASITMTLNGVKITFV
ncbi:MAG: hypothetical protein IJ725_02955 [Ruminococcus sp.]|nr:hypothetical protein [Ruminococcus sp.]